jgi:hypothetical protein
MARLLILLLGRRWALIACGVALAIAGLIWGAAGSHQVSYENSQQNGSYHIGNGSQSGNIYINADGSSDYFVALSGSFSPPIAQSDIDNSKGISFVARTDTTSISLDVNGTTINEAHPIEKLIFYDKNGKVLATHITAEYTTNPNGFYDNEWPKAIWLIIIGLILGVVALLYPMLRKRRQGSASIHAAALPTLSAVSTTQSVRADLPGAGAVSAGCAISTTATRLWPARKQPLPTAATELTFLAKTRAST